jgi:hypothetical protein
MEGMLISAGLTNPERWRLRAEEYRAIAAGMRDPGSSTMIERLAETYDKMAESCETRLRPLTVELCRARVHECVEFSRRMTSEASRRALLAVARQWLDRARRHNAGLEFVVTVEHKRSRRRIELIVDDEFRLLGCPEGLDPERFESLVRGRDDGEYRFVYREHRWDVSAPGQPQTGSSAAPPRKTLG